MLKEMISEIKKVRVEFATFGILFLVIFWFMHIAQAKGNEKAIESKIADWEMRNYHLTDYRKDLIRKTISDIDDADSIINALGLQQKNFDVH